MRRIVRDATMADDGSGADDGSRIVRDITVVDDATDDASSRIVRPIMDAVRLIE